MKTTVEIMFACNVLFLLILVMLMPENLKDFTWFIAASLAGIVANLVSNYIWMNSFEDKND